MADDTVIFLRVSRKEARNIFESNQRNVETVAETDETARLVAGINIEHSGKVGRLIGDDTYRTTCQTCKTNEDILGKIRHNFKEIAVVYHSLDDIFHIIRNIRVCRNDSVQNGVFTVGFIRAVLLFSFIHIILRQERKQFADTHQQFFFGVTHKMSHSAFAAVSHGTTQFFLAYFLVDNGLHYVRPRHKHVALFFHHKDKVREGGRVAGTTGTGTENGGDLRNHAACHCVLIKNVGISRKAFNTFLYACTA